MLEKAPSERFRIKRMRNDPFLTDKGTQLLRDPEAKPDVRLLALIVLSASPCALLVSSCVGYAHLLRLADRLAQVNIKMVELKGVLSKVKIQSRMAAGDKPVVSVPPVPAFPVATIIAAAEEERSKTPSEGGASASDVAICVQSADAGSVVQA